MYKTILARGNWIGFSKPLARNLKSIDSALLLSEILNQISYFKTDEVFITHDHFQEEILLTPHKVRKAVATLKDAGLISVNLKGIPAKNYYSLAANFDEQVEKLLHQDVKKFNDRELKNLTTINKTKEKEEKEEEVESYIDFAKLALGGKVGNLGKAKGLLQTQLNYLNFSMSESSKIVSILNRIKTGLKAHNKKIGNNIATTEKDTIEAFKTALNSFLATNPDNEKMNINYFGGFISPNVYIKKDEANGLEDYKEVVAAAFTHYIKFSALDNKKIGDIITYLQKLYKKKMVLVEFTHLFEHLPDYILRKKSYQSVGFIASKLNDLLATSELNEKAHPQYDFWVNEFGAATAAKLAKKAVQKG